MTVNLAIANFQFTLGHRVKEAAEERRRSEKEKALKEKKREKAAAETTVGGWEKHTRGMGEKLMKMMGYKPGEGLGRDGKGISQALNVAQRPKQLGLGAAGDEHKLLADDKPPEKKPEVKVGLPDLPLVFSGKVTCSPPDSEWEHGQCMYAPP